MSNKTRISYISALIATSVIAVVLALWRSFALFGSFDADSGFFTTDISTAITVTELFAVFAIIVYSVCIYRKVKLEPVHGGLYIAFSSVFAMIVLLVYALMTAISLGNLSYYRFLYIVTVLLALLATPYFVYNVLMPKKKERHALFGLSCTLFLLCFTVIRYIASDFVPSSPMIASELISLSLITLFTVYDCRLTLRRENWALHILTGLISIIVGICFSASNLVYMFMGWDVSNYFALSNFIIFAFSLYAAVRLYSFLGYKSLVEEEPKSSIDHSSTVYAAHTEKESFTISDEKLNEQRAIATETASVNESINEKINDATEDAPPEFISDAPTDVEEDTK